MVMPFDFKIEEFLNSHKNNEYKIQLNMEVNFINVTGEENIRTFHVKSDNKEIRADNNTNQINTELVKSFLHNYREQKQIVRNGSNCVLESVDLLNIHFHSINLKRGSSYIDSPDWIKNKHATINPKNTKD